MIEELRVQNFTVFADATFKFGALNVIHGANSSGKTHLLKLAYCLASSLTQQPNTPMSDRPTKAGLGSALGTKLSAVFRTDKNRVGRLARRMHGKSKAQVSARFQDLKPLKFSFGSGSDRLVIAEKTPSEWLPQAPVFFPTRELLSVYPGFVSLYATQAIPFDETWRDTCLLLGAPIARGPRKQQIGDLLAPLEEAIGCTAILEGDRFFLKMKSPNAKVEADLVAEGYRKLSMVARLIANGSLEDKGYLFWDEPEANLNPLLVKKLAPLLIDLAAGGVQIFIATHSLFLMRELEIAMETRKPTITTQFIGLTPGENGVAVEQGPELSDSGDIQSLDESLLQSDRYLQMAWARDGADGV